MSERLEHDLASWMNDVHVDPERVERLRSVALPARRGWFTGGLRVASSMASVALVLVIGAFAIARIGGGAGAPRPPDPAVFAGDDRFAKCGLSSSDQAAAAFEMKHAADYLSHLPKMGRSPELEVSDPALVIVLPGGSPLGGVSGASPASSGRGDADGATVCVVVGSDPATAQVNVYENVDTTGLTVETQP